MNPVMFWVSAVIFVSLCAMLWRWARCGKEIKAWWLQALGILFVAAAVGGWIYEREMRIRKAEALSAKLQAEITQLKSELDRLTPPRGGSTIRPAEDEEEVDDSGCFNEDLGEE